ALNLARFLIEDQKIASKAAIHIVPLLYPDEWEGVASYASDASSPEVGAFLRWVSNTEFASGLVLSSGDAAVRCPMGALNEQSMDYREFKALCEAWTENTELVGKSPDNENRLPILDLLYNDMGLLPVEVNVGKNKVLGGKKLQSLCSSCEKPFSAWCQVAMTGYSLCLGFGFMGDGIGLPYAISVDGHERQAWLSVGRRSFRTLAVGEHELIAKSNGLETQTLHFTVNDYMTSLTPGMRRDGALPVQGIALSPRRYLPGCENCLYAEYADFQGGPLIWNVRLPEGWKAASDEAIAFRVEGDCSFSFLFIDAPSNGRLKSRLIPAQEDAEGSKVVSTLLWNGRRSQLEHTWDCSAKRTVRYSVEKGWNLVGATIAATMPPEYRAWNYHNGFHESKSLLPGGACWLFSDKKAILDITGWYSNNYIDYPCRGWRLFSPMRHIRAKGGCLEYSRESRCLRRADGVLKPGNAYWMFGE
ncbi:MAG: hypothetical protein IJS15_07460, partial [Victivallales bacterium]|nr:hypothetical protein [Victivallales bacterium]